MNGSHTVDPLPACLELKNLCVEVSDTFRL